MVPYYVSSFDLLYIEIFKRSRRLRHAEILKPAELLRNKQKCYKRKCNKIQFYINTVR